MAKTSERLMGVRWMANILPPGSSGQATIDHFTITPDTFQGFGEERARPGTYARLRVNGSLMMTDTDMELRTNADAILSARGDVVIGGLGLGAIVLPILDKPTVSSVTIIELNQGVIDLVARPIRKAAGRKAAKLTIQQGDVNTWTPAKPGRQFDFIYFDIWAAICTDNLKQMKDLHIRFRRYLRTGGRVTSWEFERLKYLHSQGRWR